MIEPQQIFVSCDECPRRVEVAGIDGKLGELVRGFEGEGWTFTSTIDLCPACSGNPDLGTPAAPGPGVADFTP